MRHLLTDLRGNPIFFSSRRFRRNSRSVPTIFFFVQNRSWRDVLLQCKTHPNDINTREEGTGNTPLHVACRLDPPSDVIRAFKRVSRVKNNQGATPLHIAASHSISAEALNVLLECARDQKVVNANGNDDSDEVPAVVSPTADLSRMGRAPIHYACMSFRALGNDAFRLLLEETLKNGNIVVQDRKLLGLDDFFNDDDETDSFVDEDGYVTNVVKMRDSTGETPLGLLFRRYRERMKHVISTIDILRRENIDSPDKVSLAAALTVHAEMGQLWEKARYIVAMLTQERLESEGVEIPTSPLSPNARAAAAFSTEQHSFCLKSKPCSRILEVITTAGKTDKDPDADEDAHVDADIETNAMEDVPRQQKQQQQRRHSYRQFRIVHASVGLIGYGCPPEMIRLAISIHPNQVHEMDEDGNLPLHIASTAASYLSCAQDSNPITLAAAAAAAAAVSDDDSLVSDAATSFFSSATVSKTTNAFDKVIKILLQQHPDAAMTPQGRTGRLPLVMAIEAGHRTWDDGIRTLLNAYPAALHNHKIPMHLYPNVLSLITMSANEDDKKGMLPFITWKKRSPNKKIDDAARLTTLYEVLKTKPEWFNRMDLHKT